VWRHTLILIVSEKASNIALDNLLKVMASLKVGSPGVRVDLEPAKLMSSPSCDRLQWVVHVHPLGI